VTIGAGGAAGIMISNPHVPWFAPEARASIRYGRANGKSSETWWDVGVRPDGSFTLDANENGGAGPDLLRVTKTGNVGIRTNEPQGALDVRLPAGYSNWNRFVVNTTNVWGDGNTQYVTIGAGGAAGIMIWNPHVPWMAGDSRASIRYGRTGGKGGDTFWDAGARSDGSFSLNSIDNGGRGDWVFRVTKTGDATAFGALRSNSLIHVTGNGGVLNLEGTDHAYMQWYPMKAAAGRKGWIGYGNTNTETLSVVGEAGNLYLQGKAGIDLGNHLTAPYGATIRDFGIGSDPHKNIYAYETLQMKDYNNLRVWFGARERFIFGNDGEFRILFDRGAWVFQWDGNLVKYDADGEPLWASGDGWEKLR
jgi:hypothetical protein